MTTDTSDTKSTMDVWRENAATQIDDILKKTQSPQTPEEEAVARAMVLTVPTGLGVVAALSAEFSRQIIHGNVLGELTGFFHMLVKQEKVFHDFVYTTPDFATTFSGTLGFALMVDLFSTQMVAQTHKKFTELKRSQSDEKTREKLNKLEVAITNTILGVEFTGVALLGTFFALMWFIDEFDQFMGNALVTNIKKGTPQMEDLYGFLYGFVLAMSFYTAFKIRAYISYYGAKDENNEQES